MILLEHELFRVYTVMRSDNNVCLFVFLRSSKPNRVMSIAVSLPNHTFTGEA